MWVGNRFHLFSRDPDPHSRTDGNQIQSTLVANYNPWYPELNPYFPRHERIIPDLRSILRFRIIFFFGGGGYPGYGTATPKNEFSSSFCNELPLVLGNHSHWSPLFPFLLLVQIRELVTGFTTS
jgi:hypothetical protein